MEQVWVVAGVGKHPEDKRLVPYLCDTPEFGHVTCEDVGLLRSSLPLVEIPRMALKPETTAPIRPRTNEYTCTVCRRRVERGDRVVMAVIVEGIGFDPELGVPAAKVSGEYEVVHKNCRDPKLDMGGVLVVTGQ